MYVSECSNILALYNKQQQLKQSFSTNGSGAEFKPAHAAPEELSTARKIGIASCSVLGVAGSLALLAKFGAKKSLNPKTIIKNGIKNSYVMTANFKSGSIISMVAGSILGGLIGGAVFDKKEKFSSKTKEAITQGANATVPILLVEGASVLANKLSQKLMPNFWASTNFWKKAVSKLPAAVGAMGALALGMFCANKLSGKLNEKIYNEKTERNIKITDFTAHVDDIGVASTFVLDEKNPVTKFIQRCIPVAMCVPGYEVGKARADYSKS